MAADEREKLIEKICNALRHHSEKKQEPCGRTINRIAQDYARRLGIVIAPIDLGRVPIHVANETEALIDRVLCYHDRTNSAPISGTIVLARLRENYLCIEGNNRINALRRGEARGELEFIVMDV